MPEPEYVDPTAEIRRKPLAPDVQKLHDWNRTAAIARGAYYICGAVGIAAATYAATSYPLAKLAAVLSGICIGILSFAQPMVVYHKYMAAARLLQDAVYRYEVFKLEEIDVIDVRLEAEMLIQKIEEKTLPISKKGAT